MSSEIHNTKRIGDTDTELLIEKVQDFVYLYDSRHHYYKDKEKKTKAWNKIAEEMDITSQGARKRWKSLRDNYLRHIKCLKGAAKGRAASYQRWPWSQQMKFLDPSLQNSPGLGKNNEIEAIKGIGFLYDGTEELEIEADEAIIPSTTDTQLSPPSQPESEAEDHDFHSARKKMKIEVEVDHDPFTTMSEDKAFSYIQNTHEKLEIDGIDHLFLSYAHTFRKFQPATQALMKVELATLFAKTEMKELGESFPQSGPSTS